MARLGDFRRKLGCKLLMLFLWTIFVCCVLYASRESKMSTVSSNFYRKRLPLSRLKRSEENMFSIQGRHPCGQALSSQKDLDILKRFFRARKHNPGRRVMHCSVVVSCDGDEFQAHCYSFECNEYQLRVIEGNRVIPSLSREQISEVVGTALRENNFMTVEDLNRYLDVQCHGPTETKLHLTGDMFSGGKCNSHDLRTDGSDAIQKSRVSRKNIHVLYFRFLSVLEFPFRFPGLTSLLRISESESNINVMSFDKHQATKWSDADLLSTLLQGKTGQFHFNDSLLGILQNHGYCFRLQDFSCGRSKEQEILLKNVTSTAQAITCHGNPLRHRESITERLCTEGNLTETKMRTVLTSLLYNAHELQRGEMAKSGPVFSLSVLNIRDFRHPEFVDNVLRNFFLKVMNGEDSVTVLLSGAGNPQFLSFDHPERLQQQASNPILMLASTGGQSAMIPEDVQRFSLSLFSMQNIHFLVKNLVRRHDQQGFVQHYSDNKVSAIKDDPETCERLGVSPPFKCLCANEFVDYENDTLMAGFAEFAVSILNKQLENLPFSSGGGRGKNTASPCGQLSGLSFGDVRVGHYDDRTRILMGLYLVETVSKDRFFRRVVLDIWDTDKTPKSELYFSETDNVSPQARLFTMTGQLLKTLCKTDENLRFPMASDKDLLQQWSQERHFGRKGAVLHVHDECLFMIARDFGDSVSVEAANTCHDRRYDVMLHLSLINTISLSPFPLSVRLGHAQKELITALVKVSYSVTTFDFRLNPDFEVFYDE